MTAVDTNIIVRLLTGDDDDQVRRALDLAAREIFYVSFTVLIETEWVLRSRYGYSRDAICTAFMALPDLVAIRFEDDADVRWAIERYALGGEFADYLHLAAARAIGRFTTFERRLAARAGDQPPARVEILA